MRSRMLVLGLLSSMVAPATLMASALSDAAARLAPGQSIRLTTTDLWTSVQLQPLGDCCTMLTYGESGVWDPVRREARYIGKKPQSNPYYFLVYAEKDNRWTVDRALHADLSAPNLGHGSDGNAVDSSSGTHYFRLFASNKVYRWDGTWSRLPDFPGNTQVSEALTWFDGVGLIYTDRFGCRVFSGGTWNWCAQDGELDEFGYHSISEYQPNAKMMLFGGGNAAPRLLYLLKRDSTGALRHQRIPDAPFGVGSHPDQGLLVADPSSNIFLAWARSSPSWSQYDPVTNGWTALTQTLGDGSSAAAGAPALKAGMNVGPVIAIPISTYGVIMFVEGYTDNDAVWLYRHAAQAPPKDPPTAPSQLRAE